MLRASRTKMAVSIFFSLSLACDFWQSVGKIPLLLLLLLLLTANQHTAFDTYTRAQMASSTNETLFQRSPIDFHLSRLSHVTCWLRFPKLIMNATYQANYKSTTQHSKIERSTWFTTNNTSIGALLVVEWSVEIIKLELHRNFYQNEIMELAHIRRIRMAF